MAKTVIPVAELEQMIIAKLRTFANCNDLQRVNIIQSEDDRIGGNWEIKGLVRSRSTAVDDCHLKAMTYAIELRKDYDVAWPQKLD